MLNDKPLNGKQYVILITVLSIIGFGLVIGLFYDPEKPPVKTNIVSEGIKSTNPDKLINSLKYKEMGGVITLTNAQEHIDKFPYLKEDAIQKVLDIQKEKDCDIVLVQVKSLIRIAGESEKGSNRAMWVESVLGMWAERAQELNCQWK